MGKAEQQGRFIKEETWRHFWHPVCTLEELHSANPSGNGPLRVRLLGENLAVAKLNEKIAVFSDRCAHRSTALSRGFVEDGRLRCRYHGWAYDISGVCVDIPACRHLNIPGRAKIKNYDAEVKYDLVWVRLEAEAETQIPPCPGYDDEKYKTVIGKPYTWPTSAARRLENFVDLAHFPYVHPNTLFDPNITDVTPPSMERIDGQLVFQFDPKSDEMPIPDVSLMGKTDYQITMPFTVNLEFELISKAGKGNRAVLWMSASPIDEGHCRSFWFTCRDHDKDEPDYPHLAFQERVLDEDIVVIEAQDPPQIPYDINEISVPADMVSIQYRRWLREIEIAVDNDSLVKNLAANEKCA